MVVLIGYLILAIAIGVMVAAVGVVMLPALRRANVKELTVKEEYPEPHEMSWIGRQVMKKYNALPDSHKPSHDIRAAVVALDVKYAIRTLDSHFNKQTNLTYSKPRCNCTDKQSGYKEKKADSCIAFPEFGALWTSMLEIQYAITKVEQAEKTRQRKIELAGIENDLNMVPDILNAFRIEAEALRDNAREIA